MKNEPFDVPMADPKEDEFAFLKNIERRALMEMGEYDVIRGILEEERKANEEAERELAEEKEEMTMDEINAEISAARAERKRRG